MKLRILKLQKNLISVTDYRLPLICLKTISYKCLVTHLNFAEQQPFYSWSHKQPIMILANSICIIFCTLYIVFTLKANWIFVFNSQFQIVIMLTHYYYSFYSLITCKIAFFSYDINLHVITTICNIKI